MAATHFDPSLAGNSFLFDIYTDGQPLRDAPAPAPALAPTLPAGPCNYTDQALPRCGCRRFWSRPALDSGAAAQSNAHQASLAEICMCSHHACFHEDAPIGGGGGMGVVGAATSTAGIQNQLVALAPGQENERPKSKREPLSPMNQDLASCAVSPSVGAAPAAAEFNLLDFRAPIMPQGHVVAAGSAVPSETAARPRQDSSMPDTLTSWGNFLPSQGGSLVDTSGLPPIPAECLLTPPQPPSTATSSHARYLRPFGGKGLQTLNVGAVAAASRDGRALVPFQQIRDAGDRAMPPTETGIQPRRHSLDAITAGQPSAAMSGVGRDAFQQLSNTVQSHEQRLDRLESASFSVAGHEQCQDKHESVDLRVTELESRIDEVEKLLTDNSSSVGSSRRILIRAEAGTTAADDATASVVSLAATEVSSGQVLDRGGLFSQLRALEAQVSRLQAASLPSYMKPWELEVVFLPFALRGVWIAGRDFPSHRASDEWTQMPNTISRATPDPVPPKPQKGDWLDQPAKQMDWLLAKAFPPGRIIEQRLKSRGLIKTVSVRGPDARSVQLAINNTFQDVLRMSATMSARVGQYRCASSLPSSLLGLRQDWVPLRKVHKDSRLCFLTRPEMATPAVWDFTFLSSSVVMKATGLHRLYITTPEAYLQDHAPGVPMWHAGWSWQMLREMSRVYPDTKCSSNGDVPEADAMEKWWAWNQRLDELPSRASTSIGLAAKGQGQRSHPQQQQQQQQISGLSRISSSTQQFFTGVQSPVRSHSPSVMRPTPSPVISRERRGSRPPRVRTASLPPAIVPEFVLSPSQSRRRVVSYGSANASLHSTSPYERHPSPLASRASSRPPPPAIATAAPGAGHIPTKGRRIGTPSPSIMARNTPRWSVRPSMSRSPSVVPGGVGPAGQQQRGGERRTTPFAYATPFSDAHAFHRPSSRGAASAIVPPPSCRNGYEPEDEDEDMEDSNEDDHGSSTDPYDSEMTQDAQAGGETVLGLAGSFVSRNGGGLFDDDGDINVFEDEDDLDEGEAEGELGGSIPRPQLIHHRQQHQQHQQHRHQPQRQQQPQQQQQQRQQQQQQNPRPEDIPWLGIEDNMSDDENMAPQPRLSRGIEIHEDTVAGADEAGSDSSSQPSEYPSTQMAWQGGQQQQQQQSSLPGINFIGEPGLGISESSSSGDGGAVDNDGGSGGGGNEDEEDDSMGFRIHEDNDNDNDHRAGPVAVHWG